MGRQARQKRPGRVEGGGRTGLLLPGCAALVILAGVVSWLILAGPSSMTSAGQPPEGPRLSVDTDLIDFGDVPFRKYVEARFRIRNVGNQPLTLPANPPLDVLEGC